MSLWKPVKISKDKQLEQDKRVILNIAKEKLQKDLAKVERKLKEEHNKWNSISTFTLTKSQTIKIRNKIDNMCYEKDTTKRRIELINKLEGSISNE